MTPVKLHRKEFEYWNIVPLKNECAVIGLLEKYNAPGTVIATVYKPGELMTSIKGSGNLGVIVPTKPEKIFVNGKIFDGKWNYKDMFLTISIKNSDETGDTNVNIFFHKSEY